MWSHGPEWVGPGSHQCHQRAGCPEEADWWRPACCWFGRSSSQQHLQEQRGPPSRTLITMLSLAEDQVRGLLTHLTLPLLQVSLLFRSLQIYGHCTVQASTIDTDSIAHLLLQSALPMQSAHVPELIHYCSLPFLTPSTSRLSKSTLLFPSRQNSVFTLAKVQAT